MVDPAARFDDVDKAHVTAASVTPVLRGFTAALPAGAVTVLSGPSGCGKSTALRLLAGLDRPDRGEVTVAGSRMGTARARARRRLRARQVAYVWQDPVANLLEGVSVVQHVRLAARLRGVPAGSPLEHLAALGLEELADRVPQQLSGGQQQRVAVACAVVGRPALVVADEPTAELDSRNGDAVLDLLRSLAGAGQAVVLASHEPAALARADVVVDMEAAR